MQTRTWSPPVTHGVWERTLRALGHALLRAAAQRAQRRQWQARRRHLRAVRRARRAWRTAALAAERELARRLSPALRRDLGL